MAEQVHPVPIRVLDEDGIPVAGAELYAYRKGTTTPLTIYADSAGAVAHPVPLVADDEGVFAAIYNTSAFDVKIDVKDPTTNVSLPGYPIDPAITSNDGSIAAVDVTFAATTNINQTNMQAAVEQVDANWRAAKTGIDEDIVSGTAGTDGNLAQWNSDGDLVDGPDVLDEDDMASDSATAVPTQQSVKAYVDAQIAPVANTGWTTLGTLNTATGTPSSVTLTSLTLTDYETIQFIFDGVGVSGTVNQDITIAGGEVIATGGTGTYYAIAFLDLSTGVVAAIADGGKGGNTSISTASTSITVAVNDGTFNAGSILVKAR